MQKCLGRDIYYEIHGETGDYLVVLNGMMMMTKAWYPILPTLKEQYRVVLLDLVDQGASEKMDEPYTNKFQADIVNALMDNLGIKQAYIMGTSYGGTVGLLLALHYPQKIKKMFFFAAGGYFSAYLNEVTELWKQAALSYDLDVFTGSYVPYVYSPAFFTKHRDAIYGRKEVLRPLFSKEYCDAFVRIASSAQGFDVRDRVSEITCPILIAAPEIDLLIPINEVREFVKGLPNGELVIIPDTGHVVVFEKSALIISMIIGWFQDIDFVEVF